MSKPLAKYLGAIVVLVCLTHAQAIVYLSDTFSGNSTVLRGPGLVYGTLATMSSSYQEYVADSSNVPYTIAQNATAGVSGGPGLKISRQGAGMLSFGGVQLNAPLHISEWHAGSVTASNVGSLQLSFDIAMSIPAGTVQIFFHPSDASNNSPGSDTQLMCLVSNPGTGGFQHVTFNTSSLSTTTLQAFANDLNGDTSNYIQLQMLLPFYDSDTAPYVTISNLKVQTSTVYLSDTFSGSSVQMQGPGNPSVNLSTSVATYFFYMGENSSVPYTFAESATIGAAGGPGLKMSRAGTGSLVYGGMQLAAPLQITEWHPGLVTATNVGTLQLSLDVSMSPSTAGFYIYFHPSDSGNNTPGSTQLGVYINNPGGTGFQHIVLNASTLGTTPLQAFANSLNTDSNGASNYVQVQAYIPFTNSDPSPYVTLSNLQVQTTTPPGTIQIPTLNWAGMAARSDWINVKTDPTLSPHAAGDGVTDDTTAIQTALNLLSANCELNSKNQVKKVLYFPPGTYKISAELTNSVKKTGIGLVGCGNATTIQWYGVAGGTMFLSNSLSNAYYIGLRWDGRNVAAVGFDHNAAYGLYEHSCMHKDEEFLNCTDSGLKIDSQQNNSGGDPTAELTVRNCYLHNNGSGFTIMWSDDFNEIVDSCYFSQNNWGVDTLRNGGSQGNFVLLNSHFEANSGGTNGGGDIEVPFCPCEIRRCTSNNSNQFAYVGYGSGNAVMFEDCKVANWTSTTGAIHSYLPGTITMVDCDFSDPSNTGPAVQDDHYTSLKARTLTSNDTKSCQGPLIKASTNTSIYDNIDVPVGSRSGSGVVTSASTYFFSSTDATTVPSGPTVYDAVAYGADPTGTNECHAQIQACIDAARNANNGSIAYIPAGNYKVGATLNVYGSNYRVVGSGMDTTLQWPTSSGGPIMQVTDPLCVRVEYMAMMAPVYSNDTVSRITQTSSSSYAPSSIVYDMLALDYYTSGPFYYGGITFSNLSSKSTVVIKQMDGDIDWYGSSQASGLVQYQVGGWTQVKNAPHNPQTGYFGEVFADCNVVVADNQDLTLSDIWTEQLTGASPITITGPVSSLPNRTGHVTIGGSRVSQSEGIDYPAINVTGYNGNVSLLSTGCDPQQPMNTEVPAEFAYHYDGTNAPNSTCNLSVAGVSFVLNPTFSIDHSGLSPGCTYVEAQNGAWNPTSGQIAVANVNATTLTGLAASFDDLSLLGQQWYNLAYGLSF